MLLSIISSTKNLISQIHVFFHIFSCKLSSRVNCEKGLYVLAKDGRTKNAMYKEAMGKIIIFLYV